MFYSLPKDVKRIIAKKKSGMETMAVMITLDYADILLERNMTDAAYHFSVKSRRVSSRMNEGVVSYEGEFRSPMIVRGKKATVALIKAFLGNHVINTEEMDEDDDDDDYSEDDINVYIFQSASTIQEACKIENRNDDKLTTISSMLCRACVVSSRYTAHMRKLWLTLDNVIEFIGTNELVDVTKEPVDSKERLAGV
jgi:hypothetical protein